MYIVFKAFDDNTADILNLSSGQMNFLQEDELIKFGKSNDILGLSVDTRKINYIQPYTFVSFPTEYEMNEYIRMYGISHYVKKHIHGIYYIFTKSNNTKHVDYYICSYSGPEVTYLAESGYTPYIQAAKSFDKKTAQKQAVFMTNNSKTGKHWKAERVVI